MDDLKYKKETGWVLIMLSVLLLGIYVHKYANMRSIFEQGMFVHADVVVENLDQIFIRKSRQSANTFYSGEAAFTPYYWQPQTFVYSDVTTGREVWKLSNTRSGTRRSFDDDIALQPWSADGKRLAYRQEMLAAQGLVSASYTGEEGMRAWFIVNTDGAMARPIPGSPLVCAGGGVFPWSPLFADVFHWFGETHCGNSSAAIDTLYRANVTDTNVTRSALFSMGTGLMMRFFDNSISSDGTKAMAVQSYMGDRFSYRIWPITLYPTLSIDIPKGYTTGRPHDGTYWGASPGVWSTAHSGNVPLVNLNGSGSYWYFWVDSYANGTGFLTKLFGSEGDGGPGHTIDHTGPWAFSDFGENVPIMAGTSGNTPWIDSHYWSHPAFDRWGKYVAYSDSADPIPYGLTIENLSTKSRLITKKGGGSIQHNSWTGWTDYVVSTRGAGADTGCLALGYTYDDAKYTGDRIYVKKYNDNANFIELVRTHTLFNNSEGCYSGPGNEYPSIPRPSQSPDGTKVAFHSSFTVAKTGSYDDKPDLFWTVAYYPHPPEVKSAIKNGSNIRLTWDFNQGTAGSPNYVNPRTYTKRGWPNEETSMPAAPREIKNFRVWSSTDTISWSPVGSALYHNCTTSNECGTWSEVAWNFDVAQPNNTTRYYAVTSVEHSGLESHTLSNIWKVITGVSGSIVEQVQQAGYPADPGGNSDFYTSAPDSPRNVVYVHKQAPAIADGQYTLTWSDPADAGLVRYYNIYAKDATDPTAIQQDRIASIAASSDYDGDGAFTYVDWLGNTDGSTRYLVTAVDFQGNESSAALPADVIPPSAPTGLLVL